ncbi:putative baseplate assembly protein [Paraburkholderia youngii]|uniref:putative baseplate assembly protein n=1 Tax=Paraburkholderia youngii TaxID=2782701 RepID=UPI003D20D4EA
MNPGAGDCGCCAAPAPAAPAPIANRPGLAAIAYRIGTFATFREALIESLSHTPELTALRTRVSDDYTITVIELWSVVADVLTFYQERTANEAFLRTATQRDSLLRLVRLIGYELGPAVAATAQLAFTLEAAAQALIPAGTRVQSVPGEGEKPQIYETLAALNGDGRLNRLRIFGRPVAVQPLAAGQGAAVVAPDPDALANAAKLAQGDRVMLYSSSAFEVLTVRDVSAQDGMLTVSWSAPIHGSSFTQAADASSATCRAYRLGRAFRLFGVDAPASVGIPVTSGASLALKAAPTDFTRKGDGSDDSHLTLDSRYEGLQPGATVLAVTTLAGGVHTIPFIVTEVKQRKAERTATPDGGVTNVTVQSAAATTLTVSPLGPGTLPDLTPSAGDDDVHNFVIYELTGDALRFWPYAFPSTAGSPDVYLPGRRSGWSTVEIGRTLERGAYKPGGDVAAADFQSGRAVLLTDAAASEVISARVAGAALAGSDVSFAPGATDTATIRLLGLDADQAGPVTVALSGALGTSVNLSGARELSVRIGALPPQRIAFDAASSGTLTLAQAAAALRKALNAALPGAPGFARAQTWVFDDAIAVAAGVPEDAIAFAPTPGDALTVAALGLDATQVRYLDGALSGVLQTTQPASGHIRVTLGIDASREYGVMVNLPAGAAKAASALETSLGVVHARASADGERMLVLPKARPVEPLAFVRISVSPVNGGPSGAALDAASATLLGNVAPASQGETVRAEILGDGDASQAWQPFTLRKKPLTFVPAATPGGLASTLSVLVNGEQWAETPTFYGAGPRDRVYVTRRADDGTVTVRFGDGDSGARAPSGRQNVVATYRFGGGLAGRVGAGKLSTLLDRPTGVKGVTNLLPADGGADPQGLDSAREAAPGQVRTFGRAVSLRDFEDTALTGGVVAKALATWAWTGERRAIHLSVAPQAGGAFSADALARISATLGTERDPNHRLIVANYAAVPIRIAASLNVDPKRENAQVLAAARAALLDALSFEQRAFAQPVFLSDMYRVLQDVEGVVSVDIDVLDLKSTDAGFRAAHGVDDSLGQPQPRILILPAHPGGSPGVVLPAELAVVELPAQDVVLRANGGLSS